jgi:hypothetical protein
VNVSIHGDTSRWRFGAQALYDASSSRLSESVRTPDNWTIWSNELSIVTNELNNVF